MQTTFEYNLEFINNKRHSIPTAQLLKNDKISDRISHDDPLDTNSANNDSTWWWDWWQRWLQTDGTSSDDKETSDATVRVVNVRNRNGYVDEDIIGSFGESWDVCRPCSDHEMVHAYCSSDIGNCELTFKLLKNGILINCLLPQLLVVPFIPSNNNRPSTPSK